MKTADIDFESCQPDNDSWPSGVGMIYLAMSPWEGMWKNRHQLMSRFAEKLPVLYVEPPVRLRKLRRTLAGQAPFLSIFRRSSINHVKSGLFVYRGSPLLAVSGSRLIGDFTARRWFAAVMKAAAEIGIQYPLIWISQPEQLSVLDAGKHLLSIYHIVDEYAGYTGATLRRKEQLASTEQKLLDRVDLTIAVSPELVRAKSGPNRDVRLVENAVDLRQFEDARRTKEVPEDLQKIPCPRLGYSGLIGKRLDLRLIREVAQNRPKWSFVMIGVEDTRDCETLLSGLKGMPNVYFLGEKQPSIVASYILGMDLGMLPYQLNIETAHISPLKMYEYLAAGLPVVSTAIPAAKRMQQFVAISNDAKAFELECEAALSNKNDRDVALRIDEASRNTWDHRVTELTDIMCHEIAANHEISSRCQ